MRIRPVAMLTSSLGKTTVGAGANGAAVPQNFSTEWSPATVTTGEGSTSLGFYNVQNGDVPYFKSLADNYAMSETFTSPSTEALAPITSC